jgi:hypothetical protein
MKESLIANENNTFLSFNIVCSVSILKALFECGRLNRTATKGPVIKFPLWELNFELEK